MAASQISTPEPYIQVTMGFDTGKFVSKVSDDRKCALCNLVLDNPVQTPCLHVFCSGCALPWVVTHGSCPFGCQDLNTGDLNNVLALRDLVLNMRVVCDFKEQGCTTEPRLKDFFTHTKQCDWRQVDCKNTGCEVRDFSKDIETHETDDCNFRATGMCKKGCDAILYMNTKDTHNCVEFLKIRLADYETLVQGLDEEINNIKAEFTTQEKELRTRISCLQKRLQMQGIKLVKQLRNYECQSTDYKECQSKVST